MTDLKLSDLYNACEECGGTGWLEKRGNANPQGFGVHVISSSGPCERCNGQGGSITPAGEVLAQFMQALKKLHRL